MPTVIRKIYMDESEEELLEMTRAEVTEPLTDKEQAFCEYYCKNFNIRMAAIKAGYTAKSAHVSGYKIRRKKFVNRYICWLKLQVSHEVIISAADIIDKYARIAFADITDFVTIKDNRIKMVNGDEVDGQLIKSIKQGRDGVSVELHDKLSALDKLERYFDVMPADWRQKIEERKVEIMKERLELERIKSGTVDPENEDDGFIDALRDTAEAIWDSEE